MDNTMGIFGAMSAINVIESLLRILAYIAFISVAFKAAQALNVYINKNLR